MEERRGKAFLICVLLSGLVSQYVVSPVMCRRLEGVSPKDSLEKPSCACDSPHGGSGSTPSHGRGGSHRTLTPSHGRGGSYGTPSPSHGGSHQDPTPSHGSGGSYGTPTPTHGGSGGYYNPPSSGGHSSPVIITPPSSPATPTPSVPVISPTPTTPVISTPPSTSIPDPNTPPFFTGTCNYWSTHPEAIWAIFGYWGSVSKFFGAACSTVYGKSLSLPEALTNTRSDGIGALYREGTASLLNSIVNKKFVFSTQQVKDAFAAAVVTDKSAAAQAELFKQANEGYLKH